MQDDYLKRRIFYLCLCLAVPVVITFALSGLGQRLASGILEPFACSWHSVIDTFRELIGSADEESAFAQENHYYELLAQQRNFERLKEENQRLRLMLGMSAPVGHRAVHAEIVGRDPVNWNWAFWVDCGKEQGVQPGDCVITGGYLVGRVLDVQGERSKIVTLASPKCKASVLVRNRNGDEYPGILIGCGNVNGNPGIACHVDYLSKDVSIRVGDEVFTSGLGGEVPYGIPVGNAIADAQRNCPDIIDHARACLSVKPGADIVKLSFVTIYIKTAQKPSR